MSKITFQQSGIIGGSNRISSVRMAFKNQFVSSFRKSDEQSTSSLSHLHLPEHPPPDQQPPMPQPVAAPVPSPFMVPPPVPPPGPVMAPPPVPPPSRTWAAPPPPPSAPSSNIYSPDDSGDSKKKRRSRWDN